MKKTAYRIGVYLIAVILTIIAIYAVSTHQIDLTGTKTDRTSNELENVTMSIISKNWSLTHYYEKTDNTTVFSLLNQTAKIYNFKIVKTFFTGYDSFFIDSINYITNGMDNNYWQFKVNGQYADRGCSSYVLSNNDHVEWIFQKSEFL